MSKSKYEVVHLTSVHSRYDIRIFVKMCSTLAANGYKVTLVVADGLGDESKYNISIIDVGAKSDGRFARMTKTIWHIYNKAKALNGDVYHFHDPELIPIAIMLKNLGKRVIFDAHEDLPRQILAKPYLSTPVKIVLSKVLECYERWACSRFDGIIAATPFILNKFLKINPNSIDVCNFPLLKEFVNTSNLPRKSNEVAYLGRISRIRGINEILDALDYCPNVRLNLAGCFSNKTFEEQLKHHHSWSKVNNLGFLDRKQVSEVLSKSTVGLVTLHPTINYTVSLPIKMFEYMAVGIPIISSNFPLWLEIVEGNQCGLCVDPTNPTAIAEAIQYLIDHPDKAEEMGKNGRRAIEQRYNWSVEECKLLNIYKGLLFG